MKKAAFSVLLVGASALYALFSRTSPPMPALGTVPESAAAPAPAPVSARAASPSSPVPPPAPAALGAYKDGTYTGTLADAYYGYVQVRATIAGGALSNVTFLSYPSDRDTSRFINAQAMPYLRQEAIAAQSANVNIVSGATDTSIAFRQSLASALSAAKNS